MNPIEESQYVELSSVTNNKENDSVNNRDTANDSKMAKDKNLDKQDSAGKQRKPVERRESSRLQNAAKKLRRSLSSKVVSNKHANHSSANDDYVDIRSLAKDSDKRKTNEENQLNTNIEKNGDDGKGRRRSSASAFFSTPHLPNHSEIVKASEEPNLNVNVGNRTKEKRSHSFNGRSDSKKAAKIANLVRRESSSHVGKRHMSQKEHTKNNNVSSNPNGSNSKSCDDLLDPSKNNIYAEIPNASTRSSLSGAVPSPYCTISELFQKPEETHPGAKSILLTEDNLSSNIANQKEHSDMSESEYVSKGGSPDLIQNLPQNSRNPVRQISSYVSKSSYSVLRAEDNYNDYDYVDEFRSSNITTATATGFGKSGINHNNAKDHEEYYSSIIR